MYEAQARSVGVGAKFRTVNIVSLNSLFDVNRISIEHGKITGIEDNSTQHIDAVCGQRAHFVIGAVQRDSLKIFHERELPKSLLQIKRGVSCKYHDSKRMARLKAGDISQIMVRQVEPFKRCEAFNAGIRQWQAAFVPQINHAKFGEEIKLLHIPVPKTVNQQALPVLKVDTSHTR